MLSRKTLLIGVFVGTSYSTFRLPTLVRKRNKHANFDPPLAWLSLFTGEYRQRHFSDLNAMCLLRIFLLIRFSLEPTLYDKFVCGRLQEMFIFITDLDHFTGSLSKLSVSIPTKGLVRN